MMHPLFTASCLVAATAVAAGAQDTPPEVSAPYPQVDQLLSSLEDLAMFNGHVMFDRGGNLEFSRSYGMADYAHGVPVSPDTRFRVASLSKPMTDAALAVLIGQGRLSLETTLAAFLPEFPSAGAITLRHLIAHRSGIRHTNTMRWSDGSQSVTLDQLIEGLSRLPLDFEPGSERRYSNGGYAVLSRVLELETGLSYPDLMDELVFTPLGMDASGAIVDSRVVIADLAEGYEPGPVYGSRRRSRFYAVEAKPGGGSLFSTPRDVLRFFRAVYRGDFPDSATNRAVFGPSDEIRVADGRSPGFNAVVRYDPATDLLIISMANNYAADFGWAGNLALLAAGEEPLFRSPPATDTSRVPGSGSPLIGSWRYENPNFSQDVKIEAQPDGQLFLDEATSESRTALVPLADGGFLEPMYFGICEMAPDDPDRINCRRFYETGFRSDLVRKRQ